MSVNELTGGQTGTCWTPPQCRREFLLQAHAGEFHHMFFHFARMESALHQCLSLHVSLK